MFSITYTPMDVKAILRDPLTEADRDALDAANAYYADAGKGYHTFAQTCSGPTCTGYWCITISDSDPMFRGAIDRAVNGGLCRACQDAHRAAAPSLITYRATSGGNGASGGSRGRSHRTRQSQAGTPRLSKKAIEARIKQLAAMIANPGQTPDEVIQGWQREQEALTAVLVSYSRKRKVA